MEVKGKKLPLGCNNLNQIWDNDCLVYKKNNKLLNEKLVCMFFLDDFLSEEAFLMQKHTNKIQNIVLNRSNSCCRLCRTV